MCFIHGKLRYHRCQMMPRDVQKSIVQGGGISRASGTGFKNAHLLDI